MHTLRLAHTGHRTRRHAVGLALVSLAWAAAALTTTPGAAADGPGSPHGTLDVVSIAPGGLTVAGWAKDPDSPSPITVHVYIDGVGVAAITATNDRPDLGSVIAERSHGYEHWFSVPAGRHTVCTYGINNGLTPGGNALLGCKGIDVANSPFGSLDVVEAPAASLAGTSPSVAGWAIDPDTDGPVQVDVYVDGAFVRSADAAQVRQDVGGAYPSYGDKHGFAFPIPVAFGSHEVCAYALNRTGTTGDNALLGCRRVQSLANRPFGSIDHVAGTPTGVTIEGWGVDPYSAVWTLTAQAVPGMQGTGPLERFAFTIDGQAAGTTQSSIDRTDVVAATPPGNAMFRLNGGPRYGFSHTVAVSAGTHEVCTTVEHHPHVAHANTAAPDGPIGCVTITR